MIQNYPRERLPEIIRPWEITEVLPSAVRSTTTSTVYFAVPRWANAVAAFLDVTAVPGVDTVTFNLLGSTAYTSGSVPCSAAARSTTGGNWLYYGPQAAPPTGLWTSTVGTIYPLVAIQVAHSGAGNFTYRASFCWIP